MKSINLSYALAIALFIAAILSLWNARIQRQDRIKRELVNPFYELRTHIKGVFDDFTKVVVSQTFEALPDYQKKVKMQEILTSQISAFERFYTTNSFVEEHPQIKDWIGRILERMRQLNHRPTSDDTEWVQALRDEMLYLRNGINNGVNAIFFENVWKDYDQFVKTYKSGIQSAMESPIAYHPDWKPGDPLPQ